MPAADEPSHSAAQRRNIELKARLDDLAAARQIALRLGAAPHGIQRQTDTYFVCAQGRLKLREIDGALAQLIWYERPDRTEAKASDYLLVPVADPAGLRAALSGACGVLGVVRKEREILLFENVRIHLDEVEGLGRFLEFEAVLGPEHDDEQGERQIARLSAALGIAAGDRLAGSYADLLLFGRGSQGG